MSTLSIPSPVATPSTRLATRIVRCPGCHSEHAIPADKLDFWPMCHACRKSSAWAEARKLLNDVLDLRRGTGVFADLTLDERLEQLAALGIGQQPQFPRLAADSIPVIVRDLPSDQLVDLAGAAADEIATRMGSTDVHPADRTIEPVAEPVRFIDDPEYAPDSAVRIAIEDQLEDEARELVLAGEASEQDADRWDGLS